MEEGWAFTVVFICATSAFARVIGSSAVFIHGLIAAATPTTTSSPTLFTIFIATLKCCNQER